MEHAKNLHLDWPEARVTSKAGPSHGNQPLLHPGPARGLAVTVPVVIAVANSGSHEYFLLSPRLFCILAFWRDGVYWRGEIGGWAVTDWLGRRNHARYPIVVPILYGPECSDSVMASAGWTRDLSEGGVCLELSERLEVSAPIRLFLRTDQGGFAIQGKVIWAEGPLQTGGILHGVGFTRMALDQHQAVRELLLRRRMVWRAVVRIPVQIPVFYQLKGQPRSLHQGQTENVSRRGLLLRLPLVYSHGTLLEVTLHTPHGHLTAEGTIAHVEPLQAQTPGQPIRHGFHFTDISYATQITLGRVLAEAR